MEIVKVLTKEPQPPKDVIIYMVGEEKFTSRHGAEWYVRDLLLREQCAGIPRKTFINSDGDRFEWFYISSETELPLVNKLIPQDIYGLKEVTKLPAWVGVQIVKDSAFVVSYEGFKADMLAMQSFLSELDSINKEENNNGNK